MITRKSSISFDVTKFEPRADGVRCSGLPVLLIVSALAVWRLVLALTMDYDRLVAMFDDDAYYYFQVARNLAHGRGSTFDGIDLTNGYHPLWMLLNVPVFAALDGRSALIGVTLLSCGVFIMFGVVLAGMARAVRSDVVVVIAAAPILALSVVGPSYFFSGMETGLAVVAISGIGLIYLRTRGFAPESATVRTGLLLGMVMVAGLAARLDSIITLGIVGLFVLFRWRRQTLPTLAAVAPPATFLLAYVIINMRVFGTPTPISGQAKSLGSSGNSSVLLQFFSAPTVFGIDTHLGLLTGFVVVAAIAVVRRKRLHDVQPRGCEFGAIVYFGSFVTMAYYSVSSSWQLWPWYFYGIPIALLFSLLTLASVYLSGLIGRLIAVLSLLLVAILAIVATVHDSSSVSPGAAYISTAPQVAERVETLAPAGSPIAVGDRAGSIGYHLNRPTIQLEGLVNSSEYLDALASGNIGEFLNDRNVALYMRVDADSGELVDEIGGVRRFAEPHQGNGPKADVFVADSDLLMTVPLPDGTSYRIWRYRSSLNP